MKFLSLITAAVTFSGAILAFDPNILLALVNQQRALVGAPALTIDPRLDLAARRHTLYQATMQQMTHDEPNTTLGQRISATGYPWSNIGENVAAGYGDAVSVLNAWMNSPAHRRNILDPIFTQTGIAYVPQGSYWTQEFGRPMMMRKRTSKFIGGKQSKKSVTAN
ncbi:SCP-domain-containing protein [Basidiobolus meristosporus CBS 931.73]|uniref:SCP-domain-containing protein n=1 Tax=Basidiobolus meristosporus CBS 931.73 TaxID=1314790 RepID=A0A1Y1YNL7_9FUNG|nr:SCP-domain-containing protein [Basidiobolus meristosporus CBS 931.73]|eukprot:ORX99630.1 SCP-domain-containing protein [Basidiobolus meristosporus CBS 931.73]